METVRWKSREEHPWPPEAEGSLECFHDTESKSRWFDCWEGDREGGQRGPDQAGTEAWISVQIPGTVTECLGQKSALVWFTFLMVSLVLHEKLIVGDKSGGKESSEEARKTSQPVIQNIQGFTMG